jgi:hypothetical protein
MFPAIGLGLAIYSAHAQHKENKRARRESEFQQRQINEQKRVYAEQQKKMEGDLARSREKAAAAQARMNASRRRGGLFDTAVDAQPTPGSPTLG